MRKIAIAAVIFVGLSCKNKTSESIKMNPAQIQNIKKPEPILLDSITEFYNDSLHIGVPGRHRLELRRIIGRDSIYAELRFFEKLNSQWVEKQYISNITDGIRSDPEFADFNNDGLNDVTYISAEAARGANEIRTLFIFEPKSGMLTLIKNSEKYPNLQYNEKLDCIDAFAVYGGTTSYFLKIEQDSLRPFARIDLFDGYREVYTIDKTGKSKLARRDPFEMSYLRYKNFDPLEEYENF